MNESYLHLILISFDLWMIRLVWEAFLPCSTIQVYLPSMRCIVRELHPASCDVKFPLWQKNIFPHCDYLMLINELMYMQYYQPKINETRSEKIEPRSGRILPGHTCSIMVYFPRNLWSTCWADRIMPRKQGMVIIGTLQCIWNQPIFTYTSGRPGRRSVNTWYVDGDESTLRSTPVPERSFGHNRGYPSAPKSNRWHVFASSLIWGTVHRFL